MKIALIGTRGIPAQHGGFETCVEEVGARLAQKGHTVWVYSKKSTSNESLFHYKGMKIVKIPRICLEGFETIFSTFLSVVHSLFFRFDVHMVFNAANSPALLVYKIFKKSYALNTDGLEWKRTKWGFGGRNYYKVSEWISVLLCEHLVSDSQSIHDYYQSKYRANSTIIAYGADRPPTYPKEKERTILNELGLGEKKYLLQITRFEPENHPLMTLQAFNSLRTDYKCVVVGGAKYRTSYLAKIDDEKQKNENIVLPGFIYDKEKLDVIWQNSFCYIHGNSVGGTNPALLQAMAAGRPIIALDCIFNREVLRYHGFFYKCSKECLAEQIRNVMDNPQEAEDRAGKALQRVLNHYNWDLVADQYEALFLSLVQRKTESGSCRGQCSYKN